MPTTNNGQKPSPPHRADTDELVADVLAANADCGAVHDPEKRFRETLNTFIAQVRENGGQGGPPPTPKGLKHPMTLGFIKYVLTAVLAMGAAYGGLKLADKNNAEQIKAVNIKADVHDAKTAHSGAATRIEVKAIEDKVQTLDKSVIKLGTKIDGQEVRQKERHDDIKEELRYLRRRRNRRDD